MTERDEPVVSLRDYIDIRLKAEAIRLDNFLRLIEQHFDLNELAIKKAEEAMLVRLGAMNEFREQLTNERAEYVTKESLSRIETAVNDRIKKLETANAFSAGRLWMIMALFATVPTILALLALFRGG